MIVIWNNRVAELVEFDRFSHQSSINITHYNPTVTSNELEKTTVVIKKLLTSICKHFNVSSLETAHFKDFSQ